MTATQQFIEDAIKGGWRKDSTQILDGQIYSFGPRIVESEALLDPLAWQATVKSQLSKSDFEGLEEGTQEQFIKDIARTKMHRFIDHLADGDDIETALSKLI